ncbi:MAG: branched-chain amino acid ABC transporter permease [Nitriliruptor sp.]|uniref:ABC transporter permease subunit n=1 Tax=Nitriliruptor sp. TaxID=2448056 RepID=UPI0034A04E45
MTEQRNAGGVRVVSEDDDSASADTTAALPVEPGFAESSTGEPSGPSRLDQATEFVTEHRKAVLAGVVGLVAIAALGASRIDVGGVVVDGVSVGAVYAMVALGIALVYRSTKVLNFAQGELGTVPAFLVLMLLTGFDRAAILDPASISLVRLVLFALVGVLAGAVLAIGVNTLVVQRLAEANPVTSLVATAGVSFLLIGGQVVVFELQSRTFPRVLQGSVCFVRGDDGCLLQTNAHNLVILSVLVVVAAGLALLFRTQLGTALLATAQEPFAAALHGVSPRAMSSLAWGLAGGLAALGGILGAGYFAGLTPGLMTTTFLIPAFTAAVLGGMTSMTGAVVGGVLVGLVAALANAIATTYGLTSVIPSPPTLASFVVLLLVLLIRPRGLFGKEA